MTTPRLLHSTDGYLRYMQMSATDLFIFVEGKQTDSFIVGEICQSPCTAREVSYQVVHAREIRNTSGGKSDLLVFFDYLRKQKALKSKLGGKTTYAAFFVDKDIDDILRKKRRSPYVIYSNYYDLQNDLFLGGQLDRAVAAAASIDPSKIPPQFRNSLTWCCTAAERWKEWVVLCVATAILQINHQCNYRLPSQVQDAGTGLCDAAKVASMKSTMLVRSCLDSSAFTEMMRKAERLVSRLYAKGHQDSVFKGKWYSILVTQELDGILGHDGYNRTGFDGKLFSTLATTLNMKDPWARRYKNRIEVILNT